MWTQRVEPIWPVDRNRRHVRRRVVGDEQRLVGHRAASRAVVVEPLPRFHTEVAASDHLLEDLRRLRVLVGFQRPDHDIDPEVVGRGEGALGERGPKAHRLIDLGGTCHIEGHELGGLVDHRREDADRVEGLAHLRREFRSALPVGVEAFADLVPHFLPVDEVLDGLGHGPVRVHDQMMEDVDADLVGEFEWTHRESRAEPHRGVDRLDRDAFPLMNPGRPLEVRPEDARRDESGDVFLDHDDRLAERLREIDRGLEGRVARRVRPDDFDERHEHRRVEEVHPDDLLRSLRGFRHLRDRQRGRVRREDRLRWRGLIEFTEDLPLQLRVLEDRLDHEVRIATGVPEVDSPVNPSERLVRLRLGDLLFLDQLAERPAYPFEASVDVLGLDVPHPDVVTVQGRQLRDAMAHLPRADHREFH